MSAPTSTLAVDDAASAASLPAASVPSAAEMAWQRYAPLLAMAFAAAPMLFEKPSMVALPGFYGRDMAKSIEAVAILGLSWLALRARKLPYFELPAALTMLFLAHAALSLGWGPEWAYPASAYAKLFHHGMTTLVIVWALRSRRDLDLGICAWKTTTLLVSLLAIAETVDPLWRLDRLLTGHWTEYIYMEQWEGIEGLHYRARGPSGHPNYLGFLLAASLLLQPYLWARFRGARQRLLIAGVTAVEVTALVLAYVRLGVAGVVAGVVWLCLRGVFPLRAILLALVLSPLAIPLLPSGWIERLVSPEHLTESRSIQFRAEQAAANLDLVRQHWLVGSGYGSYGWTYHQEGTENAVAIAVENSGVFKGVYRPMNLGAHDTYLEVIIEQGALGLGIFVAIGISALVLLARAGRRARGDPAFVLLGKSLEAMLIAVAAMQVILHTQDRRTTWLVVGLSCVYIALSRAGPAPPAPTVLTPPQARVALPPVAALVATFAGLSLWKPLAPVLGVAAFVLAWRRTRLSG